MSKTIAEINEKIRKGQAVVVTAEEVIDLVRDKGLKKAAQEVDVVTTATFGPMCSSGAYLNTGHPTPRMKFGGGSVHLNDVPAYPGFAAVDIFIGATALPDNDPRNKIHPGEFNYGGGHVIEELVAGKDIRLVATAYGTDCYPRKRIETLFAQLCDQFMLKRNYAKSTLGLSVRILTKITAVTLLQFINSKNDKPINHLKYALAN